MMRTVAVIVLVAAAAWAKNDKQVEHRKDRIVVKEKDKKGKFKTAREFPLMFDNNRKATQNGQGGKK